uniref:Relaxin-3 receptor 2-like n=1 Tax=Podarcis muralis TaxID=64176 RepID=A0A670JMX7_PODMU|nr:relaxin-3 receptor 2-like [Podarcis muralis]
MTFSPAVREAARATPERRKGPSRRGNAGFQPSSKMQASGLREPERNSSLADPRIGNWSLTGGFDLVGDGSALTSSPDISFGLQMFIAFIYSVVCSVGLLGNGLVMYLIWTYKGRPTPVINIFVFGLAVADFQLSLTLPFWATEIALDYKWPFGQAMCKAVPSLTTLSVHANVFLLTAMSVTRYWSVASALKDGSRMTPRVAQCITVALWALALVATVPVPIYTKVVEYGGMKLCFYKFPTTRLLGIYHLQKVVFTFVVPLVVILTSYLLLLKLLKAHQVQGSNPNRQNQVATTVQLVVGCFFVCWLPKQAITLWGALVQFEVVSRGDAFYFLHNYIFPLATCLAHSSSCLNPVLYCLMRQEFREATKEIFQRLSSAASSYQYFSSRKTWEDGVLVALPRSPSRNPSKISHSEEKEDSTLSTILEPRAKEPNAVTEVELIPGVEMLM